MNEKEGGERRTMTARGGGRTRSSQGARGRQKEQNAFLKDSLTARSVGEDPKQREGEGKRRPPGLKGHAWEGRPGNFDPRTVQDKPWDRYLKGSTAVTQQNRKASKTGRRSLKCCNAALGRRGGKPDALPGVDVDRRRGKEQHQ